MQKDQTYLERDAFKEDLIAVFRDEGLNMGADAMNPWNWLLGLPHPAQQEPVLEVCSFSSAGLCTSNCWLHLKRLQNFK